MVKSKRVRWAVHLASMQAIRTEYAGLVGKPERKIELGRSKCKREVNIK